MALKFITSAGKFYLSYNGFKFRETRTLVNKTISWRCCSKNCSSWIKTNANKTSIIDSKIDHNHRSTASNDKLQNSLLHQVDSPKITPKKTETSIPQKNECSIPTPSAPTSPDCPSSPLESQATPSASSTQLPQNIDVDLLLGENISMKQEIIKLKNEIKIVLDHSVESDLRLLQYTDEVFTTNKNTVTTKSSQIIQTDPLPPEARPTEEPEVHKLQQENSKLKLDLSQSEETIKLLREELELLNRPCERCSILKEETGNMIESLRLLEAEIKQLKKDLQNSGHSSPMNTKSKSCTLSLQNNFEILNGVSEEEQCEEFTVVKHNKKNKNKTKKHKRKPKQNKRTTKLILKANPIIKTHDTKKKLSVPFKHVNIYGDSHARNIPILLKEEISGNAVVSGTCKPGAGLLQIAPTSKPVRGDCSVLIAGTNDVSSGQGRIIYKHLEDILKRLTSNESTVLVTSIPRRHDLAKENDVHEEVATTNGYIEELCNRLPGVMYLDTSHINRKYFTGHGLHLRMDGKRILSEMIAHKLTTMKVQKTVQRVPQRSQPQPTSPLTLGHESFAHAVRNGEPSSPASSSTDDINQHTDGSNQTTVGEGPRQLDDGLSKGQSVFLGPPLHSNGLN